MYKSPFQFQILFLFHLFFYLHLKLVLPLHGALYKIKILCARSLATNHTVQGLTHYRQNFLFFS